MAIGVSCACGKRLSSKDELAGRRAKCPGCGTVLQIPLGEAAAFDALGAGTSPASRDREDDDYGVEYGVAPSPAATAPVAPMRTAVAASGYAAPAYASQSS